MNLVLLSGGVDSALVLWRQSKAHALFVDYGHPARSEEWAAVRRLCDAHGGAIAHRAAVSLQIGAMGAPPGAKGPRVVHGRNLVLIAIAANYAAGLGCRAVLLGAHGDDGPDYPDCRPGFIFRADKAAAFGCGVLVKAPLQGMPKRQIAREARALGVPLGLCWSCYTPVNGAPCGTCNACEARRGL